VGDHRRFLVGHTDADAAVVDARSSLATGYVLAMSGLIFGVWSARLADVKERLDVSSGLLGLAMFLLAVGAIASMAVAPRLIARFGLARVAGFGIAATYVLLVVSAAVSSLAALAAAQLAVGLASGAMGVALNIQAVALQERAGRPIASRLHGCHSGGGLLGALLGACLADVVSPAVLLVVVAAAGLGGLAVVGRWLPDEPPAVVGSGTSVRISGSLVIVAGAAAAAAFGESSLVSFGAIHLRETLDASRPVAALGFGSLAGAMVVTRNLGPAILSRWSARHVLTRAGTATVLGGALVGLAPAPWVALAGGVLVGAGVALVIPTMTVLAAATQAGSQPAPAVRGDVVGIVVLVATGTAVLSGPIVGLLTELGGTRLGLGAIALAGLVIAAAAPRLPEGARAGVEPREFEPTAEALEPVPAAV